MPFWSKVMKLTVDARGSINPAAGTPATNPVTTVDVALSEDVTRKLALCMKAVPKKEADATKFLNDRATAPERAAATTVPAERDLLMRLVLKEVGSITGAVDRDFRMAVRMGTGTDAFGDILKRRAPADFPD